MKRLLNKRIPTILAIFLAVVGLGLIVFLTQKKQLIKLRPEPMSPPQKVYLTNVQDKQFSVFWTTQQTTAGFIKYGETPTSLNNLATDDRDQRTGETHRSLIHHVTIRGLEPEKKYFFKVGSGRPEGKNSLYSHNGQPYEAITGPPLEPLDGNIVLSGKVLTPDNSPAKEIVVILESKLTTPLSVLTDKNGHWTFLLNEARAKDLSSYPGRQLKGKILTIQANSGEKQTSATLLASGNSQTVPKIVLGQPSYDFSQSTKEETPRQMITIPTDKEKSPVIISNPAEEGEEINSLRPQFKGKAQPNSTITVTIESTDPYTASLKTDDQGNWSFTPPFDLAAGEHTLKIAYFNDEGEEETVSRNFVVLAAGESELPAITATPSGELSSPSPLPSPSASPTTSASPRASVSPSPSLLPTTPPLATPSASPLPSPVTQMPAMGTNWPAILILLAGVSLVLSGFGLSFLFLD